MSDINIGKHHNGMNNEMSNEVFMMKDCDIIQSLNNSEIM